MGFELNLLNSIHSFFRCDFLDAVMPYISSMGNAGIIWIVLALALLCFKKTRKQGAVVAISLIFCLIIGNLTLKPIINRPRPYEIDMSISLLVERLHDGSFPSGHTLSSFAASVALFCCYRKKAIPALVLAVIIAFSRLYLRVHFPSDVLAGIVLGTLIGYGVYKFVYRRKSS